MENETIKTWQQVIDSFFANEIEVKKAKVYEDTVKKVKSSVSDKEVQEFIAIKKEKGANNFLFQESKIIGLKKILHKKKLLSEFPNINQDIADIEHKYKPCVWLEDNSRYVASYVSIATHVAKMTHSSSQATSFRDEVDSKRNDSLTTSSLTYLELDGAIRDAKHTPIARFLLLKNNEDYLAEKLTDEGCNLFNKYSDDIQQKERWYREFRKAIKTDKPSSCGLAKQVYFPVDSCTLKYHLLSHLYSSSMAQRIFEATNETSKVLKVKKESTYREQVLTVFPRQTNFHVTSSAGVNAKANSNVSTFNSKRGGKQTLLSCEPPQWQSQLKPPLYKNSFFYSLYSKRTVQGLSDLLGTFEQAGISFTNPNRLKGLQKWVAAIFNEVLDYVCDIQMLPSGWSTQQNIKLKPQHQYLLDCYRDDQSFIEEREQSEWQKTIIDDFVSWLNDQLHKVNVQFTPTQKHNRQWRKIAEPMLREYVEGLIFPKVADVADQNAKEVADA